MSSNEDLQAAWEGLGTLLGRLARGEVGALDDLQSLAGGQGVPPSVAQAAENLGLILVKLEGLDFLLTLADQSERRLREVNELKNRHLGIAAHDLRNPLGVVRGLATLMSRGGLEEDRVRQYSESIVRIGDELIELVASLLDVATIEAGHLVLEMSRANLASLVRNRCARATTLASSKGISLQLRCQDVPDTSFDALRMGQVVDNLISNALKFSPPGSTVDVSCELAEDRILITVRDDGPGIPPQDLRRIFDAHYRSVARPTGGETTTGLGLSIAKPIVEGHGGKLEVSSVVGEGSRFTINLPAGGQTVGR